MGWLSRKTKAAWDWLTARTNDPPSQAWQIFPLQTYEIELPPQPDEAKVKSDYYKINLEWHKLSLDIHKMKIEYRKMELEEIKWRREFTSNSFRATIEYSKQAIGFLFAVNGGAAIAILAQARSTAPAAIPPDWILALKWFAAGCVSTALCGASSYIAQAFFTDWRDRLGTAFQCFSVVFWLAGIACFGVGAWQGSAALR